MSDPLLTTFGLLASTGNPHAVETLIVALDSRLPEIQHHAALALLKRAQGRGVVELIRRLPRLTADSRRALLEQPAQVTVGLRQSLIHGDRTLRLCALELLHECDDFEQVPTLLGLLRDPACPLHDEVGATLGSLTDRLYDEWTASRKGSVLGPRRIQNLAAVRSRVLTVLDQAIESFPKLLVAVPVVRAVLALGDSEHFAVKRVLTNASADCRDLAIELLKTDRHPGVMQLILDSLSRNYPNPRMLEAFRQRRDVEFIAQLLRWVPEKPTLFQQKNLRQIESIAWLDDELNALAEVPPGLEPALVSFLSQIGLPLNRKVAVQEWLVRHGTPEGREAAAGVLSFLDRSSVQDIIMDSLGSKDEETQAWATSQLRQQNIPHAVTMLVQRLDSPAAAVRLAAQGELQDFNVGRMLELFDQLEPELCRRAGDLVRKVDPSWQNVLDSELCHPVRRKRIRAARAALALGLQDEVTPSVLIMLDDEDPLVRRVAVEVLAQSAHPEVAGVLRQRLEDPSPRVRESAKQALRDWFDRFGHLLVRDGADGETALAAGTSEARSGRAFS